MHNMKFAPSTSSLAIALAVLFITVLIVSSFNTYMIYTNQDAAQRERSQDIAQQNDLNNQFNDALYLQRNQTGQEIRDMADLLSSKIDNLNARLPIGQYDYVVYRYWNNVSVYSARNGRTGVVDFNSTDAGLVLNQALTSGNSVYVKADEYTFNSNIDILNKKNARLDSDGATLQLNQNSVVIRGDDFSHSQNNQISGLIIVNGTTRIENSFRTTVTNMIFENCTVAVELANTNTWTEGTRIDTVHFDKCTQGIVFRTNTTRGPAEGNSTGSYANTQITRCYFNQRDNSLAVTVEAQAEFTDGQMQNVRIWMGEFDKYNQTGLQLDGSMYKTLLDGVVFESFASLPLDNAFFYAIKIGKTAFQAPVITSGVNILGNWSARIFNPYGVWVYGVGGVFAQANNSIPVGISNGYGPAQIIQVHPATIANFKPKVTVQGSFQSNETITVRFRVEFLDNVVSRSVQKTFANSGSLWLSDDDFLQLYAYPDVIYAILVDAKATSATTDAAVQVDVYGTTT
jgi:hypothetical protein